MTDLKKIVEEIESTAKEYRTSDNHPMREIFNQYVELIILEAPKPEQYNLCYYWERLTKY